QQGEGPDGGSDGNGTPQPATPVLRTPDGSSSVLAESAGPALALAASQTFFETAPVVVLASAADDQAQARAASAAVALGMPVVLAGGTAAAEDGGSSESPAEDTGATEPDGETTEEPATEEPEQAEDSPAGPEEGEQADGEDASTESPAVDDAALAEELTRLQAETALVFGTVSTEGLDVDVVRAPADDAALVELLDVTETEVDAEDPVLALLGLEPGELGMLPSGADGEGGEAGAGAAEGSGGTGDGEGTEAGDDATAEETPADEDAELPATAPADGAEDLLVLTTGEQEQLAAVATARAAQAAVEVVPDGDPRASSETVQILAGSDASTTVGLGAAFGDAETLGWRVATASTGTELPGGGQLVLPGKTYVALYGNPTTGALGVLGEQGPEATVERAQAHADPYEELTDTTVVPALEIIATVASATSGEDGNYSSERPIEELRPLVDLARENGQYVVLDLQPGRTDFLTQAQLYEELLLEPHVGLALDPEWRLEPDEVHLRQIGQVDIAEVNEVVTWLADLTRDNDLPQKLLILHQFQVRMIPGVDDVDQSRSELAVLIHVDGQGSQPAKQDTWRVLRNNAPSVDYWGWKNFYDEDVPMLTPEQTMQVEPAPEFISYQ
ncbi:hypothetical protein PU560_07810, partial [Georgenia sp. 10Sc9-8]|nr:hypothetical protein [Georgenia halotolerans]